MAGGALLVVVAQKQHLEGNLVLVMIETAAPGQQAQLAVMMLEEGM